MLLKKAFLNIGVKKAETPNPIDRFLERYVLIIFPSYIKPNHLTFFRYLSVPFIFYLLFFQYYLAGLIAFTISVLTDLFDGAMARTRRQITFWGKVNDPLADKLLIGIVGAVMIIRYVSLEIMFIIIFLEVLTITIVAFLYDRKGNPGSILPGKIKMVFQSLGVLLLTLFALNNSLIILDLAVISLYISILFSTINVLFCFFVGKSL